MLPLFYQGLRLRVRKVHTVVHSFTHFEIVKSIYVKLLVRNEFRANQLSVFFETKPKPVMMWDVGEEKYSHLTEKKPD